MRHIAILAALAGTVITTGCGVTLSVNRLYTDKDLVSDFPLEGKWTDEKAEDIWEVRKDDDGFVAVQLGKGESGEVSIHVVRIGQTRFLDIANKNTSALDIEGHLFMRVRLEGEELAIESLNWEWLKDKAAQAGLGSFESERKEGGMWTLTAPTADLQKFIALYANEPKAFQVDIGRWHRVR